MTAAEVLRIRKRLNLKQGALGGFSVRGRARRVITPCYSWGYTRRK